MNIIVFTFSSVLTKTLIVMGLAEKTTAETLKSVFEGCQSARVPVDKEKGVSRGWVATFLVAIV